MNHFLISLLCFFLIASASGEEFLINDFNGKLNLNIQYKDEPNEDLDPARAITHNIYLNWRATFDQRFSFFNSVHYIDKIVGDYYDGSNESSDTYDEYQSINMTNGKQIHESYIHVNEQNYNLKLGRQVIKFDRFLRSKSWSPTVDTFDASFLTLNLTEGHHIDWIYITRYNKQFEHDNFKTFNLINLSMTFDHFRWRLFQYYRDFEDEDKADTNLVGSEFKHSSLIDLSILTAYQKNYKDKQNDHLVDVTLSKKIAALTIGLRQMQRNENFNLMYGKKPAYKKWRHSSEVFARYTQPLYSIQLKYGFHSRFLMSKRGGYAHNLGIRSYYSVNENLTISLKAEIVFNDDPDSSDSKSLKINFAYSF
jgi:hypothetical protein